MNKPRTITREEHQLDSRQVDSDAFKIIARLQRYGYEAYVVGGGVRDLLLKKQPKDFDVATNATPKEIVEEFKQNPQKMRDDCYTRTKKQFIDFFSPKYIFAWPSRHFSFESK